MMMNARVHSNRLRSLRSDISRHVRHGVAGLVIVSGVGLSANDQNQHSIDEQQISVATTSTQRGVGVPISFALLYSNIGWAVSPIWSFGDGTSSTSNVHTYTAPGTYTVTYTYPTYGGPKSDNKTFGTSCTTRITIFPRPSITGFTPSPSTINRGQGSTLNWSASGAYMSLALDQGIGSVGGTSRSVAPSTTTCYTLTASNAAGSVTATCTVTVNQPPAFGAIVLPAADVGRPYSQILPAATDPEGDAIAYSVSGLPYGLTFAPSSRTLSGMVLTEGSYTLAYTATDAKGFPSSTTLTLPVNARATSQNNFTTSIGYGYDPQGRLETIGYPDGRTVQYGYDDLDRVTSIAQNRVTLVRQIVYNGWGNRKHQLAGSGAVDEWGYDGAGRVTQWTLGIVGGTPETRVYAYDAADRLIKAGEWGTLGYDVNSRLTQAESSSFCISTSLAHDAYNNNISSVTSSACALPASLNNFTFDPEVDNHLPGLATNRGLTQVTEDNFGEITGVGTGISSPYTLSMSWDGLGRMLATKAGTSGAIESFEYAASGMRVTRTDSLDTTRNRIYAYTGTGHLLAEYAVSPTPAWARDVVYLGDTAIAEIDANGVHELHGDHQGTPRVITSTAGVVEGRQAYGPYGELLQQTGYIPLTGYTGHLQTEPTGLIYMRGRFYSPAWHRFMNSDQGVAVNLLNQFAYTMGNPLMDTDPTGMEPCQFTTGRSEESRERARKSLERDLKDLRDRLTIESRQAIEAKRKKGLGYSFGATLEVGLELGAYFESLSISKKKSISVGCFYDPEAKKFSLSIFTTHSIPKTVSGLDETHVVGAMAQAGLSGWVSDAGSVKKLAGDSTNFGSGTAYKDRGASFNYSEGAEHTIENYGEDPAGQFSAGIPGMGGGFGTVVSENSTRTRVLW